MTHPTAMKTNGIGKRCDWLNHTVSMADDPELRAKQRDGRRSPVVAAVPPIAVLDGKPLSPREAEAMWSVK